MQNAKEGEADRLIDTRFILVAAEHLPNLRWEWLFLHTPGKTLKSFKSSPEGKGRE